MKKIISLIAAMALSLASVTALAAPAASDNIHVKLVADKATIAPGESVVVSAFISANGNADVVFDTVASIGVIYDTDNFTYEVTKTGDFIFDDFGTIWGMDDQGMSYSPDTSCVEITFTANADAAEATYAFDVSNDPADTAFCNGFDVWDSEVGNVTLTGTSVTVGKPGPVGPTVVEGETVNNITEYTFENSDVYGEDVKILMTSVAADVTKDTRFYASYNGAPAKEFGSNIWEKLGNPGEGTITISNIKFGLIVPAGLDTSLFAFEVCAQK